MGAELTAPGGGGMEAARIRVAELYLKEFGRIAKAGTTVLLPADAGNPAAMVAQAMAAMGATGSGGGGGGAGSGGLGFPGGSSLGEKNKTKSGRGGAATKGDESFSLYSSPSSFDDGMSPSGHSSEMYEGDWRRGVGGGEDRREQEQDEEGGARRLRAAARRALEAEAGVGAGTSRSSWDAGAADARAILSSGGEGGGGGGRVRLSSN